jgi:hypothetical protein
MIKRGCIDMKRVLILPAAACLGACVYGNPVNNERLYANADITKVDWSRIDGKGSSCQTNWFFGLMPVGSNSLASAVERGELARVSYVDTDTVLYAPLLMTRECTNAYGELTPAARAAMAHYGPSGGAKTPAVQKPAAAVKPAPVPAVSESASDYNFPGQPEN